MNGKNGIKNITWGILAQIITIGLGIFIPRLVLVNLGSEANGLLNSVSSILAYMALLEAGVGTATLQSLYRPLGDSDRDSINRIMSATHHFYRRTGAVYLLIVIALSIGYTAIIDASLSKLSIFLVVLLSGISGVLSYFFQGKYRILLAAEGKTYITTNISTICTVGVSLTKATILLLGGNVVLVQSVYFVFNLLQMTLILFYVHKNYPWLNLKVKPDFEALSQRKAVLVHQISALIFSNTDVIILTAFTSLKTVSVYSMYAMIFGMVKSVAVTISESFVYALGQSFSNKEKFNKLFNAYETYNLAITFSLFAITGVLILPFLKLYTSGVNDINYVDMHVAGLFVVYYLLHYGRASSGHVINFAQHFEQTKWRSVLESVINLTTSLILTFKFGIYGVILGTIIALLYRTNDMIIYAAKIMERSPWITYKRWLRNLTVFVAVAFIATRFNFTLDSYPKMFLYGTILCITIIPLFLGINSFAEPESAKYAYNVMKNVLSTKLKRN